MTTVIHEEIWKEFFDELSRAKLDWETNIQVLSDETGAQILSAGLPLVGATFDTKNDEKRIEIIVGSGTDNHQTHNIFNPKFVAFEDAEGKAESTLDIEDDGGAKTLIKFTQPLPAVVEYAETETISVISQTP
jgi:hypothetical protein